MSQRVYFHFLIFGLQAKQTREKLGELDLPLAHRSFECEQPTPAQIALLANTHTPIT